MVHIKDKSKCCGCAACSQVCPQNCIAMKSDAEGFEYPIVNANTCVDCELCEGVCPILLHSEQRTGNKPAAFAAYSLDDSIRSMSSSGGIFSLIAEDILSRGGVVFGAAFDDDFSVHHIAVESKEGMLLLRGSKYLQSRIENTFKRAKQYLDQGREVLFSGTACQIAGLKGFLHKEYHSLLTIDVLCHGVPSPKLWKRYAAEKEKEAGASLRQMFFRSKKYGWHMYAISLQFSNDTTYIRKHGEDVFMKMFLSNICLRPSCHDCKFKDLNRPSDITLGDCWGVENIFPEMDDDKGTSVVLLHTEKGKTMWKAISVKCKSKAADVDVLLPATADSRKSVIPHWNRTRFFRKLNGEGMEQLVNALDLTFFQKIERKLYRMICMKKK